MTIPEFAKLADRTPQAIYARLKQENISISELQEEDKKTLSPNGLHILSGLFRVKPEKLREEEAADNQKDLKFEKDNLQSSKEFLSMMQRIEKLAEENARLKIENAELRATAAGKQQLIDELKARVEFAEKMSLQRLPGEAAPKPSLWQRITRRGHTPSESK